jgi:cell division protease FtsH
MNRGRRYGRWLKRALLIYMAYLLGAFILIGLDPVAATLNVGGVLSQFRGLAFTIVPLFFFIIIQLMGMFWFMTRGTTYIIYPTEYEQSFDDVRGQPAAVRSTKEVLRLFMGFKNFRQMGGYPPHGILFEGPPGTGKTLMAKAIAGSAEVPIIIADGSRFVSTFLGIGNLKVRRMFTKARRFSDKYGGAVIFIDELDALGASRGGVSQQMAPAPTDSPAHRIIMGAGMGGGGMGVVNELLVGLDGFVQPKGLGRHFRRIFRLGKPKIPHYNILVIGATNRAQALDAALLRPGRFDRKIHVGLPDAEGREDVARYYLAKVRHEPINVGKFGRMSKGYSPAMIKNVVNEALIFALQDRRDALRWDDLWQAKLVEEIGLKQPTKYSPREKEMVATHEAGHAVASYSLERGEMQIQVITIQKREGALGLVHGQEVEEMFTRSQRQILARIQVSLAGLVAEDIFYGQTTTGPSSDLENATRLAAAYVGLFGMGKSLISVGAMGPSAMDGDPIRAVLSDGDRKTEVDEILNQCRQQVNVVLRAKRHVVVGIRDALLDREELIGDEIEELMAQLGEREPFPVPIGGDGHPNGGDGQPDPAQVPPGTAPPGPVPPTGSPPPGSPEAPPSG